MKKREYKEKFVDDKGFVLPGYRSFNGYIFTKEDCDRYNTLLYEHGRMLKDQEGKRKTSENMLNGRHKVFTEIITKD